MKKIIPALTALLLLCLSPLFAQDIEREVKLDDTLKRFIPLYEDNTNNPILELTIEKGEPDSDGKTEVTLTLTNKASEFTFIMFGKGYTVKELKKERPRLVFDKKSFGSIDPKTYKTDTFRIPDNQNNNYYRIEKNSHSFKFKLQEDQTDTCVFPVYRVEEKKGFFRTRLLIKRVVTTSVDITVTTKPHEDYGDIKEQYDDLFSRINETTFCKHKSHRITLAEQKQPFIEERDTLKKRIQRILRQNTQWGKYNKNLQRYDSLIVGLDHLEDSMAVREVEDCRDPSKHSSSHKCDYCDWTLEIIYNEFDLIDKRIDNDKRTKTKDVIKKVNKIYNCYLYGPKNTKNKRKEQQQEYKQKIEQLYKKITFP